MESMWADYMKEEYGRTVLEIKDGFISFKVHGKECMIYDLYIKPEARSKGVGKMLTDLAFGAANKEDCDCMTCLVDVHGVNAEKGTKLVNTYIKYGFNIIGSDNDQIVMKRNI